MNLWDRPTWPLHTALIDLHLKLDKTANNSGVGTLLGVLQLGLAALDEYLEEHSGNENEEPKQTPTEP